MMYFNQPIFTPAQLKRLEKHKYSCESQSLLDPYMQGWWNWVVSWIPLWMAPNLITMLGLMINVVTSAALMWSCPSAMEPAPAILSLACGLGLFLYQTLDAIDGKQARRTGTSSPLGELFDHGCDSLSTLMVTLATACTTSLGSHPNLMLFQSFSASTLFYCAHWQTYVTGTMRFGRFDVTEGQMCVIAIMLASALFGPQLWSLNIFNIMELRLGPTFFAGGAGAIALFGILEIISRGGAGKNGSTVALFSVFGFEGSLLSVTVLGTIFFEVYMATFCIPRCLKGAGKNGSSTAGTSVITPIIPLLLVVIVPGIMLVQNSEENLYQENPILFLITFGLMACKLTNKLIVAHMSRSELSSIDVTFLVPLAFFIKIYFNVALAESVILYISFAFVALDLFLYSRNVCLEICAHLKVDLFRIKAPNKAL